MEELEGDAICVFVLYVNFITVEKAPKKKRKGCQPCDASDLLVVDLARIKTCLGLRMILRVSFMYMPSSIWNYIFIKKC